LNQFRENDRYWPGQIIHTLHTQAAQTLKPGLRLGPTNKIKYCEKFKYLVTINRIIPNDEFTVNELGSFGKSKGGLYRGQNGNDDLAITSVNLSSLFESSQFWGIAVETYERAGDEYAKEVDEKIFSLNRKDGKNSMFDFDEIRRMNETKGRGQGKINQGNVFNLDTLDRIEKIKSKFFKS
jgi:hypothetical protein